MLTNLFWPAPKLTPDGWRFTVRPWSVFHDMLCMTNDRHRVTWCGMLTYRVWSRPKDGRN